MKPNKKYEPKPMNLNKVIFITSLGINIATMKNFWFLFKNASNFFQNWLLKLLNKFIIIT